MSTSGPVRGISCFVLVALPLVLLAGCGGRGSDLDLRHLIPVPGAPGAASSLASSSGPTALTGGGSLLLTVNPSENSLSVTRVLSATGADQLTLLAEVGVGNSPSSVTVNLAGTLAYVSNGGDNTVSVVSLGDGGAGPYQVVSTLAVGSEPRGTALTPSGAVLVVADFGDGTVTSLDSSTGDVIAVTQLPCAHPSAVAITNDGDGDDSDEKIYVTDFFARPINGKPVDAIEGFDDGKEGFVYVIDVSTYLISGNIRLSPQTTAFTDDRSSFCTSASPPAVNDTFCGGTAVPSGAFPNQLQSIAIDQARDRVYFPSIGASPSPPVNFSTNIQALVSTASISLDTEIPSESFNLNDLIIGETPPTPPFLPANLNRLDRAFAGDLVSMAIHGPTVLFVSRSGSFLLRGTIDSAGGISLDPRDANGNVRIPTPNLPNGVVINAAGTRAYVTSDFGQVSTVDLTTNTVTSTIDTAMLPNPGSPQHQTLLGKLAFFTGMGVDPMINPSTDVRSVDTHRFRDLASDSNWASCASCHPDGLTDGVTWIFSTGPRQTLPLDSSFAPSNPSDQRVFNWNAVRSSLTDFNNTSRGVSGGFGYTPQALSTVDAGQPASAVPDAGLVFNHGAPSGVSSALDLITTFAQDGIRTLNGASGIDPNVVSRGRTGFETHCATCHGGDKWTLSQVLHNRPAFASDPVAVSPQTPLDPRLINLPGAATVLTGYDRSPLIDGTDVLTWTRDVGTLDPSNPIEIRGSEQSGQASVGLPGSFNVPSLLAANHSAPYGHHGRALTLEEVFVSKALGGLGHDTGDTTPGELTDIIEFVKTIDDTTPPIPIPSPTSMPVVTSLLAIPPVIPGDGISTSLLEALVTNPLTGLPVAGEVVTFTATRGFLDTGADIDPATPGVQVATDAGGFAQVQLLSEVAVGMDIVSNATASIASGSMMTVLVTFRAPVPIISSLVALPAVIPGDGMSLSFLEATVVEMVSGLPIPGEEVTFSATAGTLDALADINPGLPGIQVATDAFGIAALHITSVVTAGVDIISTVTASVLSGSTMMTNVTFQDALLPVVIVSALTANPTSILGDGISMSMLQATVIDTGTGLPVAGEEVTFSATAGTLNAAADINPSLPGIQVATDMAGLAFLDLTSAVVAAIPIMSTVTASIQSGSMMMTNVTFLAPMPIVASLTATPMTIPGDGVSFSMLRANVIDMGSGTPLQGVEVTIAATAGFIDPLLDVNPGMPGIQLLTDAAGDVFADLVSDPVVGPDVISTVTASVPGSMMQTMVTFLGQTIIVMSHTAMPMSIPADGLSRATLQADIFDTGTGMPAMGQEVTFACTEGVVDPLFDINPPMPGVQVLSDMFGVAQAELISACRFTTTLSDCTASIPGSSMMAQVTFTPLIPSCPLERVWACTFAVSSDPGGHDATIMLSTANVTISQLISGPACPDLAIDGDAPSTHLGTGATSDCISLPSAPGSGTVAGLPGIQVEWVFVFESAGSISGEYHLGIGGGLPGGQPIVYTFFGL